MFCQYWINKDIYIHLRNTLENDQLFSVNKVVFGNTLKVEERKKFWHCAKHKMFFIFFKEKKV